MTRRVAACDLGKVSVSFVIASVGDDGGITVEDTRYELHEGNPVLGHINGGNRAPADLRPVGPPVLARC